MVGGVTGEVHCLTCGRYLADVTEGRTARFRLLPVNGRTHHDVELRRGKAYCKVCGGRAFVEYDVARGMSIPQRAA